MDLMDMLEEDALEGLRREVCAFGDEGIEIQEFVRVMIAALLSSPKVPDHERSESVMVPKLCELFEEIDRNGNGKVEWVEFTGYCVDAGFVATRRFVEPMRLKYIEDIEYEDKFTQQASVYMLQEIPALRKIASFEKGTPLIKLYSEDLNKYSVIDTSMKVRGGLQKRSIHDLNKGEMKYIADVVSITYIPLTNQLMTIMADLAISFWDASKLELKHRTSSRVPQLCATYSNTSQYVYSAGHDNRIRIWDPFKYMVVDDIVTKHKEPITDIIVVDSEETLVTCSVDKTIQIFDLITQRFKGKLTGHLFGVRQIIYSEQQMLLLSCGMETDAYGWDMKSQKLVVQLKGHRSEVVGIRLMHPKGLQKNDRGVTADVMGNFRVWDIQRSHSGFAVCLQSFQRTPRSFIPKKVNKKRAGVEKQPWSIDDFYPHCFCIAPTKGDVIAAASRICRFTSIQSSNSDIIPSSAIFNPEYMCFITVTGSDIQIWDARSGRIREEMFNVAEGELLTVLLDDRRRKFIVGTSEGTVDIHNFLNGVRMKRTDSESISDVSGLAYVNREKLLISVTKDRSIRLHDDQLEETAPSVRSIRNAHQGDITCVAYSDAFSLIASGSSDACVNVWDFEMLSLVNVITLHRADITAVMFVGNYPVIASADRAGMICLTLVYPPRRKGQCILKIENFNELSKIQNDFYHSGGEVATHVPSGVISIVAEEHRGEMILVFGDETGSVKRFNVNEILRQENCVARTLEQFPFHRTGYNARRRIHKDICQYMDDHFSGIKNDGGLKQDSGTRTIDSSKCDELQVIQAHSHEVLSLQIIHEPFSVLSSSLDRSVRIHDLISGKLLGVLNLSDEEMGAIETGKQMPYTWNFDTKPSADELELRKKTQSDMILRLMHQVDITTIVQPVDETSCECDNTDLVMEDLDDKVRLRLHILNSTSSPDICSSAGRKISNPSTLNYKHLGKEKNRRVSNYDMKEDITPSSFLREQLNMGTANTLQEKQNVTSPFRKRFNDTRPTTAPSSWFHKNKTFLTGIDNVLDSSRWSDSQSTDGSHLIADTIQKNDMPNEQSWRKQSMLIMNKYKDIHEFKDSSNPVNCRSKRRLSLVQRQAANVCRDDRIEDVRLESSKGKRFSVERFGPYTSCHVKEIFGMFTQLDPHRAGFIDLLEVKQNPSLRKSTVFKTLKRAIEALDVNFNAMIELGDFLRVLCPLAKPHELIQMMHFIDNWISPKSATTTEESEANGQPMIQDETWHRDMKDLFKLMDKKRLGYVSAQEVYQMLGETNDVVDQSDVLGLIQQFSQTKRGYLTANEFIAMCAESEEHKSVVQKVAELVVKSRSKECAREEKRKGRRRSVLPLLGETKKDKFEKRKIRIS